MNMIKKNIVILASAVAMTFTAQAVVGNLPLGGVVTLVPGQLQGGTLVAGGSMTSLFNNGIGLSGSYTSVVVRNDPSNPFDPGATDNGDLSFYYQVVLNAGSVSASAVTAGGFFGLLPTVNGNVVTPVTGGNFAVPDFADRSTTGDVIGFRWEYVPEVVGGQSTTWLVVHTTSLVFGQNYGAVIDSTAANAVILSPAVPEPTTMIAGAMLLLPFGVSTLRSLRKNRTA